MGGEGASFAWLRLGWRSVVAGALAVVVLAVVIAARLSGGGTDARVADPGRATDPGGAAATPSTSSSPIPNDGVAGPAEKPAPAAVEAAVAFVRAWANHPAGITAERWWRAVSKHADPKLAEELHLTDPTRVPASRLVGPADGIAGGASSATVAVPTDAGRVVLTCVLINGRWLVSDIDLERGPS